MDWEEDSLEEDEAQKQKQKQKQKAEQDNDEDEGTQMYAERPAFVGLDAQETAFDRGSLNRQYGINTQPSVFHSTWK